jgi:hypothetical protein
MRSMRYGYVLPKRQREKLRFGKNAGIVLLLFAVYCFVNVWQNVSITHLIRRNEVLRRELMQINRQCDMMTFELEQLKEPDHIKKSLKGIAQLVPAETITIKSSKRR